MRVYHCLCQAKLFFGNTVCSACQREVGWCDECHGMTSLTAAGRCSNVECGEKLVRCANRESYGVCNCFLKAEEGVGAPLCRSCRRTTVIPNTDDPRLVRHWGEMEAAKRRLFYDLDLLGMTDAELDREPPLTFRFMADSPDQHVTTGHADGEITINLAEADPVTREVARQQFGEPQRTVIGHLRHEFAHFLWMRLVQGICEPAFQAQFGDHNHPPYGEAMQRYYAEGPPADWPTRYISQYASAHPWEDFAETAAFYLDMRSVLDTIRWHVPAIASPKGDAESVLQAYLAAGISINEINRTLGLLDLVPEVINNVVAEKLRFVHDLIVRRDAPTRVASESEVT